MLDQNPVETIKQLMEWEAARTAQPEGFPHLPDRWTVPDGKGGRQIARVILEDSQFGEAIQQSIESNGIRSGPLRLQQARSYRFYQSCDTMIGLDNPPTHLAVQPAIDEE